MNDTVVWWQSKTIWGSIVAMLAGLVALVGLKLDLSLQEQLVELVTGIASMIGAAIAWYGRVKATRKIG